MKILFPSGIAVFFAVNEIPDFIVKDGHVLIETSSEQKRRRKLPNVFTIVKAEFTKSDTKKDSLFGSDSVSSGLVNNIEALNLFKGFIYCMDEIQEASIPD